jgi:Zn-dependent protease with chaperone function
MNLLTFNTWLSENTRHLVKLSDLDINRKYKDERYEYELFPRFRRLKARINELDKMPTLEHWFAMMQNSDAEFYTLVQTGELGQPDVRELFRDLTGRRAAKMAKYNLEENKNEIAAWQCSIDPAWKMVALWPTDSGYDAIANIFDHLGIAFGDLRSKTIYVDGVQLEEQGLTNDHLLAIEAHEISHGILNHHSSNRELAEYDERQEREADWMGVRILDAMGYQEAAQILEDRYENHYGESSEELDQTEKLESQLRDYIK